MKQFKNLFFLFCLALTFTACNNAETDVKSIDQTETTTEAPVIRAAFTAEASAPKPVKMETSSLGVHQLVSYPTDAPAMLVTWPESSTATPVTETLEPAPESTGLGGWFQNNWGEALGALLAIYEIIARLVPSLRSNSIITRVIAILNYIVPDRAKNGGKFLGPNTVK